MLSKTWFDARFSASANVVSGNDFVKLCHALWDELHSKKDPDQAWLDDWLSRVPSFGCSCHSHAKKYIEENPVDYDNFPQWACDFHNAVNLRLGKPIWTGGG